MDSAAWDERYGSGRQWSAAPNVFVAELCADLPAGRALDLGAGEGRNAVWLATRGWSVTAVDFSPVALDRARETSRAAGVTLDTVLADVTQWQPAPASAGLCLLVYLQLPAAGRRAALAAASSALTPGGTVVVVAHDAANRSGGTGGPQSPDVLWRVDETRDALTAAGLQVGVAAVRERPVDGAPRPALDTVVTARAPDPAC